MMYLIGGFDKTQSEGRAKFHDVVGYEPKYREHAILLRCERIDIVGLFAHRSLHLYWCAHPGPIHFHLSVSRLPVAPTRPM